MKALVCQTRRCCIILFVTGCFLLHSHIVMAADLEVGHGKRILVVASYHSTYKWVEDIVTSLKVNLPGARFTFYYMDTKRNLAGAAEKAREAFELYLKIRPDAVITIDDNAQKYFVVPYLKDKVKTPVVFCGVNDNAVKYGFPAGNVTGVLEKKHYREAISFAKVIKPDMQNVAVLYRKSPSNDINLAQIEREKAIYAAKVVETVDVRTLAEVRHAVVRLDSTADALLLLNMTGVTGENDEQMEGDDVVGAVTDLTNLVTIGASDWEIEAGALCGVIKSGDEQGYLAANQLVAVWEGKVVKDLPLAENKNGRRYLNVHTLRKLDLKLIPEAIIGTKLIAPN